LMMTPKPLALALSLLACLRQFSSSALVAAISCRQAGQGGGAGWAAGAGAKRSCAPNASAKKLSLQSASRAAHPAGASTAPAPPPRPCPPPPVRRGAHAHAGRRLQPRLGLLCARARHGGGVLILLPQLLARVQPARVEPGVGAERLQILQLGA
jgi:hypothetical protein